MQRSYPCKAIRQTGELRKSLRPFGTGAVIFCAALGLAACAKAPPAGNSAAPVEAALPERPDIWRAARIVAKHPPLECVPYARQASGIEISGDARTWWGQAAGRYGRGPAPRPGAVLAFRPAGKSTGHLAVVRQVVGERLIVVDHANWLNDGRIHEQTPVRDVSERGDWSAVQVWYTPGQAWGTGTYATQGFIYARPILAADG